MVTDLSGLAKIVRGLARSDDQRFKFGHTRLQTFNLLSECFDRLLDRVRALGHPVRMEFAVRLFFLDQPSGNADHRRPLRRYVLNDDGARANIHPISYIYGSQHGGARAHDDMVAQGRVALTPGQLGAAQRDAVIQHHIIADDRRLPDHRAHAMVNEQPPADDGAGMNLNPRQPPRQLRDEPRCAQPSPNPQAVGQPVRHDGMHPGIEQQHLRARTRRRVAGKNGVDIVFKTFEHGSNQPQTLAKSKFITPSKPSSLDIQRARMTILTASKAKPLAGAIKVPGDKSISHRAVMFGALAEGITRIEGLLEGEDVMATAAAMAAMGATITKKGEQWIVEGVGGKGLKTPGNILDLGNSGTSARLLAGIIAGYPVTATMTGDDSLKKRPMKRVMDPLAHMGATFESNDGKMPLVIHGGHLRGFHYDMPVASAQVKSAVLLAGLRAHGVTSVTEPKPSRDHTERMLLAFGGVCNVYDDRIAVDGEQTLTAPADVIRVPGDPSSAAFPVVAALLIPGSDIVVENVGMNPTRIGLITTLRDMGGDIEILNERKIGGEPVADLRVKHSPLKGITVPVDRVPSMVDEFPVLFVAASCASGEFYAEGLEELRVKESDRLKVMAANLAACGVELEEGEASLRIFGKGTPPKGGVTVPVHLDHRIAMSHLVLGCVAQESVAIDDAGAIKTSFPGFVELMNGLGAHIA